MKDVRQRLDVLKISSSPKKQPKVSLNLSMSSPLSPAHHRRACIRPASFSPDRSRNDLSRSLIEEEVEDEVRSVQRRNRFDSVDDSFEDKSPPQKVDTPVPEQKLPVTPILVALVASVVLNYYFVVTYVAAT